LPALSSKACEAGSDPLCDPLALKLSQSGQNVKLQLAGCCRAVDPFAKRNERNVEILEFFQHRHEMAEIPAQSVEPPADQDVKPFSLCVLKERIESWSPFLSA
jgi:hypothetical protein